ncbi:unnamed protein product [Paramecium pentaurelia]|uniref:Uncharacterized protein n=1 Tax=Paramecium pentaurelia TaxID=43138 RepID=A0A8S1UWX9_9CILI|nr:unnamed protein product [Paramecium pentaurelia]
MSNQGENYQNTLVNLINNPTTITDQNQIKDLVEKLNRQNVNLIYDGKVYCQLSGETIGTQKKVELKLPDNQTFIIIQEKLKKLITDNCFINGRFDPFYSIIYGVQFLLESQKGLVFTDPINIEITDDVLKLGFDDQLEQIKEDTKKFYEENQRNMEDFAKSLPLKCHKTQKEFHIINDGFNIQSVWFSLEGALKMLEEDKEKLFDHQYEFLNNYQKIMKI